MKRFRLLLPALVACLLSAASSAQDGTQPAVLQFLPKNTAGGLFIQPQRVLQSEHLKLLIESAGGADVYQDLLRTARQEIGIDLRLVEEFAIFIDGGGNAAQQADFDQQRLTLELRNNLKQFALAMHNMHDVYGQLPADDGVFRNPDKGNLSWRVWALPYLDQANLYNQFRMDEPWDSEHNKALIDKMPDIFRTPGVDDAGKTSVHVFTGKGAPFHDHNTPGLRDILDGTSNTILCVIAGADKAETWTKPGGLDFDLENPIKALGDIEGSLQFAFMDGSVRELDAKTDPETLANLIQHQDGNVVAIDGRNNQRGGRNFSSFPAFFLRSTAAIDRDALLDKSFPRSEESATKMIAGVEAREFSGMFVVFPDDRTLLAAPESLLKRILATFSQPVTMDKETAAAITANDLFAFGQMTLVNELIGQDLTRLPMAGLIQNITSAEFSLDFSSPQQPFSGASVETANAITAQQISAVVQGAMQSQKAMILQASARPGSPVTPELAMTLAKLTDTMKFSVKETSFEYALPKPDDMSAFFAEIAPGAKLLFEEARKESQRAKERAKTNNLKMVGLAFHNYHDVFKQFPFSDRSPAGDPNIKRGLSWRVHILPFIDEAALYNKFHLDEAWDSDHNKPLVDQMPDVYKVDGANNGETSLHVFTGENTPFDGDNAPQIRSFTDGTSNTLLVVQAGADTADVWTKPGGLEFDEDNPKNLLGKIGETFPALFADGSVRTISRNIDEEILKLLIQPDDGRPVPPF